MSARSEKFINDTRSLDAMLECEDQGKAPMLSDRGEIIFKFFKRDKISLSAAKRRYMRHRDMLPSIFDVTFGVLDI